MEGQQEPEFKLVVPPDQVGGTYANFLAVWHSPFEFTLDFSAMQKPTQEDDESFVLVPCRVVSRVKIPVALMFDVLRALNGNMTSYEEQFGPIRRVGEET